MERISIKYFGNGSLRYDGKEFLERLSNIRRGENARGALKIGEKVTIKTKLRVWQSVVMNLNTNPPPKREKELSLRITRY